MPDQNQDLHSDLEFPCWLQVGENRQRYFKTREEFERAIAPRPELHYVQGDTMQPTWHPANGKTYDSMSQFRQVTKEHGCVEIAGTNLNPGKKKIEFDHHKVAKGIHDYMETNKIDHKAVAKDCIETLRRVDNVRTRGGSGID